MSNIRTGYSTATNPNRNYNTCSVWANVDGKCGNSQTNRKHRNK